MSSVTRLGLALVAAAIIGTPAAPSGAQQTPAPDRGRPDFDVRDGRAPAAPRAALSADQLARGAQGGRRGGRARFNRETGTVRLLDDPGLAVAPRGANAAIRGMLASNAGVLGLQPRDLASLTLVRDYVSSSNGVRHVVLAQRVGGLPVFDSAIGIHVLPDGRVARVTSNAASIDDRVADLKISSVQAISAAAADVEARTFERAPTAARVWFPMDGVLRLAWHVTIAPMDATDVYDVVVDAGTGEVLLRRNRTRYSEGSGRIQQSAATAAADPRRPDAMPSGPGACPPPSNYEVRSLNAPFRDPATVLADTGFLQGNNTRIFRTSAAFPAGGGTFDGTQWTFDFPFNSAGSAETFLFFAMNFAHDFFYDLGFDEAAGNFQLDNFGRGGVAGDPLRANARAAGRNNANYVHAVDGSSPTINMFLWDGMGCWSEDVDGNGVADLDGDYDLDIVVHEYHHGVSLRLNTAWTGSEAGAIGEGGGDFFAYSVNGDTVLAEYSRPGGIRQVNGKGYGDWTCLLGIFCEVHDNGEIWANVLWDVRERFRGDLVRGSEAAAINEAHQIYVDALKLSPPAPTMLDMRDAMLEADALRNPGSPTSANFCRLWESFGGRGMGVSATDTADNGFNRVGPAFDVPAGCNAPPSPPTVTVTASVPTAFEAGPVQGAFTISRGTADPAPLTVSYAMSGTAAHGGDYAALPGTATIPGGAAEVVVFVAPIDDAALESNETAVLSLRPNGPYVIGAPSSASVTIVSDDVAPDLIVSALTVPGKGGAGASIQVTDTTRNQGSGTSAESQTSFYLSRNAVLDATDTLLASRTVGELTVGAASTAQTGLVLPDPVDAGTYYLFAKADGPGQVTETIEGNNTRIATIVVGPDLTVTALTAPAGGAAGGTIVVSDTTSNQGGGAVVASSTTRFYLSANVFLDATDIALPETRTVGPLAAGAASPGMTTVTIPADTASGFYYLFAQADAGNAVVEAIETNNVRSTTIRIGGDLTVSSLAAPTRAAVGASITITDTTRNVGGGAITVPTTTAFYLSTNISLDAADIRIQTARTVPPLGPNEWSTAPTTVTLPAVAPGTWYLIANADDGKAAGETTETNNTRFTTIAIGPDLTFVAVTAPGSAVSGTSITVNETVRNIGAGDAPATVVRFYLSNNSVFDAADVPLAASREVPALASNTQSGGATSVPLPSGTTGSFYLLVVADGTNAVAESSEGNNVTPRLIQITPGT